MQHWVAEASPVLQGTCFWAHWGAGRLEQRHAVDKAGAAGADPADAFLLPLGFAACHFARIAGTQGGAATGVVQGGAGVVPGAVQIG